MTAREPPSRSGPGKATQAAETPMLRAVTKRARSGKPKKVPVAEAREPKPVKWWLLSYKATVKVG